VLSGGRKGKNVDRGKLSDNNPLERVYIKVGGKGCSLREGQGKKVSSREERGILV